MKVVLVLALVFVLTASAVGDGWNKRCLENCGNPTHALHTSNGDTFGNAPERIPLVGLSLQRGLRPEDFARLKAVARRVAPLPPDPSPALHASGGNTPHLTPIGALPTQTGGARVVEYRRLMNMAQHMSRLPTYPSPAVYASNRESFGNTSDRVPFVGLSLQHGLRPEDLARLKAVARRVAPLPHRRQ